MSFEKPNIASEEEKTITRRGFLRKPFEAVKKFIKGDDEKDVESIVVEDEVKEEEVDGVDKTNHKDFSTDK